MKWLLALLISVVTAAGAARAADPSFVRSANLAIAGSGAERLAFAEGPALLLSTDPALQEIHLHRVDWNAPSIEVVDSFPPTDALTAIPTPGIPSAVSAHPAQPLAIALSRPLNPQSRGEALFLDLREKSAGRLLRAQLAGHRPVHVAVTPDGQWALVSNEGRDHRRTPGSIGVYDLRNLAGWEINRLAEIPYAELSGLETVAGTSPGRADPGFIAMDPKGRLAAVSLRRADAVVWVDLRGGAPSLAGSLRLPRKSRPAGVALLDRPDGSLLLAVAEEAAQQVSFHRIDLVGAEPKAELLSRVDVRPLVNPEQPRNARDPARLVLRQAGSRVIAWVACGETDRVLMLDVSNPTQPRLLARAASAQAPRDLVPVESPSGLHLLSGNGNGIISVFRVSP